MDRKQIIIDYMYERALNDTRQFIATTLANKKYFQEKIEENRLENPGLSSMWSGMLGTADQELQHLRTIEQHLSYIEQLNTPQEESEDVNF